MVKGSSSSWLPTLLVLSQIKNWYRLVKPIRLQHLCSNMSRVVQIMNSCGYKKKKVKCNCRYLPSFRNMENFPTKLNWSPMEYHLYLLMKFMLWRRFHQDQYLDLFLKPSGQNQMEKRLIKYSIIFWLVWLGQIWIYPVAHGNYNIISKNYWIGIVMNITWLHCVHFLIAD